MKKMVIGVVGGMGSYATVDFFKRIIDSFPGEKEWDRPRVLIDNFCTMPSRVRAILYNEKRDELVSDLSSSVSHLLDAGATHIILACNTSHVFLPDIIKNTNIDESVFVHIIDECASSIYNADVKKVSLMASEGTIETGIYEEYCSKYGVEVNAPSDKQYALLREFIEAVKQNKYSDEILDKFELFIDECEYDAILGCTELPILYAKCLDRGYKANKKVFDPLQSAIDVLLAEYNQ